MLLFNTSHKGESIDKVSDLIQQLKAKKMEWKAFKPKYVFPKERRISDVGFFGGGERHPVIEYYDNEIIDCHYELEYLMKHLRKDAIKFCSRYISLLKKARSLIPKKDNPNITNRLKDISSFMKKLYDVAISAWSKKLREIHKCEFKADLEIKKFRRELGKRAMNKDTGWLKKHAPEIEEILSYAEQQSSQKFKDSMRKLFIDPAKSEYWKNWRKRSLVKAELRRASYFLKFMENINYQYTQIVKNL